MTVPQDLAGRRPAPAVLSVIERLCVTTLAVPLAVPLLLGFGTCQGNSRTASPARGNSQPALRESSRLRKERGCGRHLEMGALVPNTTSSTFGLIVQDQIPRACILAVWRIHSPFLQICRRPISSVWVASTCQCPVLTSALEIGERPHRHPACRGGGVRGRQGRHHR